MNEKKSTNWTAKKLAMENKVALKEIYKMQ